MNQVKQEVTWKLHGCPRCHGDMAFEQGLDSKDKSYVCVQCGYTLPLKVHREIELGTKHNG